MKPLTVKRNRKPVPPTDFSHLQKVLDSLLDIVCTLDAEGRFVQVSKAAQAVLGYDPQELYGRRFTELVVEEDRRKTEKLLDLLSGGMELKNFQNRCRHRNGSQVHLAWSCRQDEEEGKLYAIGRDISDRRALASMQGQYERRLKRQNRQIYDMLEQIKEGFISLDEDWRVVFWNRQAEVILSRPREEVLTRNLWECFPEARETALYTELTKAAAEQVPVHFETYYFPMEIWVEFSAYPAEQGLSIYFKDISERKRTERELRKLSRVAEHTANSVILTDADQKIIWVNEGFTRITGYTFEEAVGKTPAALLQGPETDRATIRYMQEQKRKLEPFQAQVISYRKDGETYWSDVTCEPLFDEQGVLQQFFSIEIDITEKMRLQQQLEKEKEEQQKKIMAAVNKAQEDERAQVSQELHDNVNQVLTTVKLYNELCLSGIGNSEELLQKSVQLLQSSINEIRGLSKRLSAPSLGNIHLRESIKDLVDAISATNKLKISYQTDIGSLDVDTELHIAVYRILQEHLTNVLKHARASSVNIRLELRGRSLHLMAEDDGCGFDPGRQRKGIGITNMISRAESLNGTLRIKSAPGKGCSLHLTLPVSD